MLLLPPLYTDLPAHHHSGKALGVYGGLFQRCVRKETNRLVSRSFCHVSLFDDLSLSFGLRPHKGGVSSLTAFVHAYKLSVHSKMLPHPHKL